MDASASLKVQRVLDQRRPLIYGCLLDMWFNRTISAHVLRTCDWSCLSGICDQIPSFEAQHNWYLFKGCATDYQSDSIFDHVISWMGSILLALVKCWHIFLRNNLAEALATLSTYSYRFPF